jgi:N-glycosylase/DNA lyase
VADCFLLFGLHKLDAFPVDTWMKKAETDYAGDFSAFRSSPYAGVYQQYIFHYIRSVSQ